MYHGIGQYDKVLELADELISQGDKEIKIDKFIVYALDFADNDKALSIFKEIEEDLGKERPDELYTLLLPEEHKSNVNEQNMVKQSRKNNELKPTEYILFQNYPNPFNPVTTISYSIPKISQVELEVYDIVGREIAILVNEIKDQGNYKVTFDASKLNSGIYFYTIKAGDFVSTKKLIVLK